MLWPHSEEKLDNFIRDFNNLHPTIKFTYEKSLQDAVFLDLSLSKLQVSPGVAKIISKTHFKETNSFQFLHYGSFHPTTTKMGILKGETTRIERTTTDKTKGKAQELTTFIESKFHARGYPKKPVRMDTLDRPKPKLILQATYTTASHTLQTTLKKIWTETITDSRLLSIFPQPPMVAFKRNKNIKDNLVRTRVEKLGKTQETSFSASPGFDKLECYVV